MELFGAYDYLVWQTALTVCAALGAYIMFRSGLFAVPQVGLMAIGAYTASELDLHTGIPVVPAIGLAVAAAVAVSLALGLALARLSGIQLAISTLAFNQIVVLIVTQESFTGGPNGLTGVDVVVQPWMIALTLALLLLYCARLSRTRFGLAMDAMRGDMTVSAHAGIDARRYRLGAFATCGLFCGIAGALFVHYTGYTGPEQYTFEALTNMLAMVIVGGMTTYWGAILGAFVIVGAPQVFAWLDEYRYIASGILIVLVVAFAPRGLAGIPSAVWRRVHRRPADPEQETGAAEPEVTPEPLIAHLRVSGAAADGAAPELHRGELTVSSVSKRYGGVVALDSVELGTAPGEILGIVGPNGSGKTTLLNIISGLAPATGGGIAFEGRDLARAAGRPERVARLGIARTFQGIRLLPELSVLDNVWLGAYSAQHASFVPSLLALPAARRERAAARGDARALLDALALGHLADREPGELSYGHQRLVEVARALMLRPSLLLLDEPTAGMTAAERRDLMEIVRAVGTLGVGVILVEHDLATMATYCDRLVVLNFGRVIASGDPVRTLARDEVVEAYVGPVAADR